MAYIDTKYIGECETCRHHRSGKCDTWCDCGECYQPDMSKIPTADVVEVKHSRWEKISGFDVCNICGTSPAYCEPKPNNPKGYPPYCHNCGAKMRGDTE